MTFAATPKEAETLIVSLESWRVLSIFCRIRNEGEAPGEPMVAQDYVPGLLKGGALTGIEPHETRDLIGLLAFYDDSPKHLYEHIRP